MEFGIWPLLHLDKHSGWCGSSLCKHCSIVSSLLLGGSLPSWRLLHFMLQSGAWGSPAWLFLPCCSFASFPHIQPLLKVGQPRRNCLSTDAWTSLFGCTWVLPNTFVNYKGLGAGNIHFSTREGKGDVFRCTRAVVQARKLQILTLLSQDALWSTSRRGTIKLDTQKCSSGPEPGTALSCPGFIF